jgi:RNA polymerase sigma-70 factor (ECF subfamily)
MDGRNGSAVGLSEREVSPEIIDACRSGDRVAFRALYEAHKDKVYSIALYFFHGDQSAASDLTQQVFLKVITGIGGFRGGSSFSTWLHRLVVNTCLDRAKSDRRRARSVDPADLARTPASAASQEENLHQASVAAAVQTALSTLPPKLRMPVLLRYFEDLSYVEMAEALDCSIGTVASRLHRGHELLAEKLANLRNGGRHA